MLTSLRKNKIGIFLMCTSSVCVCCGQLLWKLSVTHNKILLFPGFGLYAIGALIMLVAYRFGSLSVLQPMLSLNYVLAIVLSHFILKETITLPKIFGILAIIFGVILIGGGDD